MLHAGGKFGGGGYKVSGGLHGVGVSVVNALSEWLTVEVRRDGFVWTQSFARGEPTTELDPGRADDRARHDRHVQARRRHLRDDRGRLRGDRDARARDGVPDARPAADADRPAHRGPRRRVLRRERPGRLRAAHQQEPHAHAQDADRVRARDRGRRRRDRDAVERQLPGLRALVREQHQHARGRHAPHGLPLRAHAHGQRLRAHDGPDQGEGRAARAGRRARGPRRDHLGQAPGSAVRGPDEDEARQLADAQPRRDDHQRRARRSGSRSTRRRRARSSTRRSRPRAPARPRARRATSCGARRRSRTRACPAS